MWLSIGLDTRLWRARRRAEEGLGEKQGQERARLGQGARLEKNEEGRARKKLQEG